MSFEGGKKTRRRNNQCGRFSSVKGLYWNTEFFSKKALASLAFTGTMQQILIPLLAQPHQTLDVGIAFTFRSRPAFQFSGPRCISPSHSHSTWLMELALHRWAFHIKCTR